MSSNSFILLFNNKSLVNIILKLIIQKNKIIIIHNKNVIKLHRENCHYVVLLVVSLSLYIYKSVRCCTMYARERCVNN